MAGRQFEYDSVQDNETLGKYLQAFADALREGRIRLQTRDQDIVFEPNNMIELSVHAAKKGKNSRVSFTITWTDHGGAGDSADTMEIRS